MTDPVDLKPWEELEAIAEIGDAERLESFLTSLSPSEAARALAHLASHERNRVLETLTPDDAAELLEGLPTAQAAAMMERLSAAVAAAIIHELPSDEQADLVVEMDDTEAGAILAELDPEEAKGIRALARYREDIAGGLMQTEVIAFASSSTVAEVIAAFRQRTVAAYVQVQYLYVLDDDARLVGVLPVRELLLADDDTVLSSIMIPEPVSVGVDAELKELEDVFDRWGFLGVPVVDAAGGLLGIVAEAAVRDAAGERAEADHLKSAGIVGGEELRTMPLLARSGRRLSWLSINVVLNLLAASVIAFFEQTLAAVIALAFFLPIISDMSGCSGNQAVAVSIRELALGLVKPHEIYYVWLKEIGIGILNGAALGALIGLVAWFWRGNGYLGLVVGLALTANTMIAVSIGGAVPLLLKRFNVDPALASGPVLTTITDICGFFLVLGIATAMLPLLVG
ncbi:MAG: magnesium transporter [Gemmatimonadota bacterium]|nr:magnesium transporter [Gemmatimonadota bacterium]